MTPLRDLVDRLPLEEIREAVAVLSARMPVEEIPEVIAALATRVAAELAKRSTNGSGGPGGRPDEALDVKETSRRMGMSEAWVYKKASKLPFRMDNGSRRLLFSALGLEKYMRQRQRLNPS